MELEARSWKLRAVFSMNSRVFTKLLGLFVVLLLLQTVVMVVVFGLVYRRFAGGTPVGPAELRIAFGLGLAFASMVAAQVSIVAAPGSDLAALAFGGTTAVVMSAEVAFVLHHSLDSYHTDIKRAQVARAAGAV